MQLRALRELTVDPRAHPRGATHLGAASGLVLAGRRLFVVADDEHHLGMLELDGHGPVELLRLVEGDLPAPAAQRKRLKADFESLCLLPPHAGQPYGALLVLGSGSRPNRQHVLRLSLAASGIPAAPMGAREAGDLLHPLRTPFADLNIEGAFVQGDALCLLQRGNLADPRSACIRFGLDEFLAWMDGTGAGTPALLGIDEYLLPSVDGVPLTFTDGATSQEGGWWFCAVAEHTGDSYLDGACVASAVGRVDARGRLAWLERLDGAPKVEGLAVHGRRLLLVTDADDPAQASRLLAGELPALS